jgi:hypothetical protein
VRVGAGSVGVASPDTDGVSVGARAGVRVGCWIGARCPRFHRRALVARSAGESAPARAVCVGRGALGVRASAAAIVAVGSTRVGVLVG